LTILENIKKQTIVFIATGGWIGFSPIAPGTFGSLAALPLCLLITVMPTRVAVVFIMVLICLSVWIAKRAEIIVGQKDPKEIVIDEICGMIVTLFGVPFAPVSMIMGFALFRLFDILKPFPIRWVEKTFSGGWGIVLDDIIAGVIANALLRGGLKFFG
jgi:phosphatidylglycerophosphatase A